MSLEGLRESLSSIVDSGTVAEVGLAQPYTERRVSVMRLATKKNQRTAFLEGLVTPIEKRLKSPKELLVSPSRDEDIGVGEAGNDLSQEDTGEAGLEPGSVVCRLLRE